MRFDTNSATPKLTFKASRPLTEEEYETCRERGDTPEAKSAVAMTFAAATTDVAAPAAPRLAKVLEEPEAAEEVAAEPKKRESKKDKEEPAPKKNLAAVLDAWDDEE